MLTGCGHCKSMKPAYAEAAKSANQDSGISGKFAAVDCTQESELATKYDVKGFPTRELSLLFIILLLLYLIFICREIGCLYDT